MATGIFDTAPIYMTLYCRRKGSNMYMCECANLYMRDDWIVDGHRVHQISSTFKFKFSTNISMNSNEERERKKNATRKIIWNRINK